MKVMAEYISREKPHNTSKQEKKKANWWEKALDWTQTALDLAGLVPGFGEIADGAKSGIYALRGDWTNAALSGVACIPFAG